MVASDSGGSTLFTVSEKLEVKQPIWTLHTIGNWVAWSGDPSSSFTIEGFLIPRYRSGRCHAGLRILLSYGFEHSKDLAKGYRE